MMVIPEDLDFLSARLHGRRSRMAEAGRLDALCHLRNQAELSRAVLPAEEPLGLPLFQRRVVEGWLEEMEGLARGLSPPRARMIRALARRLWIEDLKLAVRGVANGLSPSSPGNRGLRPFGHPLLGSIENLEDLAALLPGGRLPGAPGEVFLVETDLDRDYFSGLLLALRGLDGVDRSLIRPLIHQEVDHFLLMVVVRGRFTHGLKAASLLPLHIEGALISAEIFARMLGAPDLPAAAGHALGLALDLLPAPARLQPAHLEALAWQRFLRLAVHTFRWASMGFGTLVGYAALRRMEVANLITLSEGIRLAVAAEAIAGRMISRAAREGACA